MDSIQVNSVPLCGKNSDYIPTYIAVHKYTDETLIGLEAINADESNYDIVINWKLFIGKNQSEIHAIAAKNKSLDRLLERYEYKFQKLLDVFVGYLLTHINDLSFDQTPELIIGIPVTSDDSSSKWRSRYRRQIEDSFERNNYPKPKFFPEPFAVFQYHLNRKRPRIDTYQFTQ